MTTNHLSQSNKPDEDHRRSLEFAAMPALANAVACYSHDARELGRSMRAAIDALLGFTGASASAAASGKISKGEIEKCEGGILVGSDGGAA